ncbi:MAG: apolipoprotein N-acyltransferase [Pseudomonadota bacterium]
MAISDTQRMLLASLLGAALPLAFSPFGFWWLAPILLAAWFVLFISAQRSVFWIGFAFGAAAFLTGTYWLYHSISGIGKAPLPLTLFLILGMVAIMALYFGGTAALVWRAAQGRLGIALGLFAPVYVLLEWARGWILSGFPWLNLGYTLTDAPIHGWLPLGGVYLGSLVVVIFACLLVLLVLGAARGKILAGIALVSLGAVGVELSGIRWVSDVAGDVRVSIGQLGLDQSLKWNADQFEKTLAWYGQFIGNRAGDNVLVMPEVALPTVADRVEGYLASAAEYARERNSHVLLGILKRNESGQVSNALLALGGVERQWYAKRHLVPYGEFFPVPAFVRTWLRAKNLPFSDLQAGPASPVPIQVAGVPIASSICYEDAYASEQLTFFPDAQYIVNVSNDAWFGDSIAPHQHLQIARTRSLESQRWQVRATNTGISGLIDDRGQIRAAAPSFEPAILDGVIERRRGHTPYTRTGNLPVLVLSILLIAAWLMRARRLARRTGGE